MNLKKSVISLMAFSVLNLAVAPHLVEAKEMSSANSENTDNQNTLEVLATVDSATLDLLDKIPMEVAEKGTKASAQWMNENSDLKGTFIADGEYVKFFPEGTKILARSAGTCTWEVTKATALNFIPWAKVLKVKQVAAGLGGFAKLTKLVYHSYKHQRNLGLSKKKALRKAVNNVVSSKKFGNAKVEAIYQFFELDGVFKECF
ncbi:hypothetical protein LNA65_000663 [Staphylococcus pseudintermedius]|uniref:hypothetical protein n=2 Tax=Staphylococcus pseudintermedius TaxID=283734 RepID=UPI00080640DE|nr:hypothetical protein [Staphylococcus pseudintermedius]ANQ80643.1 hypothetical protein A9I66_00545 [Staphylococcus pseudintermedius]EGQ1632854.1 hypothetical protein [Staphylococcus pseudintermedius]EGQ2877089.1 hypothetical protein [Staphylococcus pseudintermedius]EGQ3146334.1 hypothetical protein [Staphylococcus pseudintermedius]EGQ3216131.1 hypothetical protein [Staphylococcus pseudintermedius]